MRKIFFTTRAVQTCNRDTKEMKTPALEIFRNGVDQAQATWRSMEQEAALETPDNSPH